MVTNELGIASDYPILYGIPHTANRTCACSLYPNLRSLGRRCYPRLSVSVLIQHAI